MSEQEEFEASDSWDDFLYNKERDEQGGYKFSTTQLDNHPAKAGNQACADKNKDVIKQQAKELAALRGFVKSIREYQDYVIMPDVNRECLSFGLIDKNGNPTKLLTGEGSE